MTHAAAPPVMTMKRMGINITEREGEIRESRVVALIKTSLRLNSARDGRFVYCQ